MTLVKGIPDKVDLGVVAVPVRWVDDKAMRIEAETREGDDAPDGIFDDEEWVIYLHNRLIRTPRYARETFLHEIGHLALDLYHRVRNKIKVI